MAEQKAVAGIDCARGIVVERGLVELAQHGDAAAVVDLVEQGAVAARGLGRAQHQEIGGEDDAAVGAARGELEVGDRRVGGSLRIEREEGAPAQLLVRARRSERRAARERFARKNLNALDLGDGRRDEDDKEGESIEWSSRGVTTYGITKAEIVPVCNDLQAPGSTSSIVLFGFPQGVLIYPRASAYGVEWCNVNTKR